MAFADVTGTITALKSGAEMVMPGDNTTLTVELGENVPMAPGMRCVASFAMVCLQPVMELCDDDVV